MTEPDRLDLVVFGATGYTGKQVVKNLVALSKQYDVRWGVAGRNLAALQAVLKWASEKTGENLIDTPIIVADLKSEASIVLMARRCRAVLNCVGPFTWYGERVVRACLEAGTHHVDITGEPYFMELMQYEYNTRAQEAEVYIVSACGIETLPIDVAVLILQDMFEGQVNSVDCYISFSYHGPKPQKGAAIHSGTLESALLIGKMEDKRKEIFQKLYPTGLKQFDPRPEPRGPVHKFAQRYAVPSIVGPDHSVVSRSQQYLYEHQGRRPAHFRSHFLVPYWILAWLFHLASRLFFVLTQYDLFCKLVSMFPRVFTLGLVSQAGPREDELAHFKMAATLRARGWESATRETPKSLDLALSCADPGYNMTAVILALAGIVLLKQRDRLPARGGVFTPGALFYKTSIMDELSKNGLTLDTPAKDKRA